MFKLKTSIHFCYILLIFVHFGGQKFGLREIIRGVLRLLLLGGRGNPDVRKSTLGANKNYPQLRMHHIHINKGYFQKHIETSFFGFFIQNEIFLSVFVLRNRVHALENFSK